MFILRSIGGSGYLTMIQDKKTGTPCYVFLNDITQAKPFTRDEAEEIAKKARCVVVEYNGPVRQEPAMPVSKGHGEIKVRNRKKPITIKRKGNKRVHTPKIRM